VTNESEGEVVCQMPAFVVAAKKEEGVGVPDLERPEIQYALCRPGQWQTGNIVVEIGLRTSIEK
jgi:hypothetical protein